MKNPEAAKAREMLRVLRGVASQQSDLRLALDGQFTLAERLPFVLFARPKEAARLAAGHLHTQPHGFSRVGFLGETDLRLAFRLGYQLDQLLVADLFFDEDHVVVVVIIPDQAGMLEG